MSKESEINGEVLISIMMNGVSYEYATNTVEIRIRHEKEVIDMKERGNVVTSGSSINNHPFPIPHLLLSNIVSFDSVDMYPLLYSTLQDDYLCSCLSIKISSEAKIFAGRPLYLSLTVTLKDAESIRNSSDEEDICVICFEEDQDGFSELPHCGHVFHIDCMNSWLRYNSTCPICRTDADSDADE